MASKGKSHFTRCSKILFVVLFFMLLIGIGLLGIGIWTQESWSHDLSHIVGTTVYQADTYILITCGCVIIAITILGMWGVCSKHLCIVKLHVGLLAVLSLSLLVVGMVGFFVVMNLDSRMKEEIEDAVITKYGIDIMTDSHNRAITEAWDRIQQNHKCCGVRGGINSTTSWAIYKEKSMWVKDGTANGYMVPKSCCDQNRTQDMNECVGLVDVVDAPPRHGPPTNVNLTALNYTLFVTGCLHSLDFHIQSTAFDAGLAIGATAIAGGLLLLVELALSLCMFFHLRKPGSSGVMKTAL